MPIRLGAKSAKEIKTLIRASEIWWVISVLVSNGDTPVAVAPSLQIAARAKQYCGMFGMCKPTTSPGSIRSDSAFAKRLASPLKAANVNSRS